MINVISKIVASLYFFQFNGNLEQSGGRIPDALSIKVTLYITFYITKTENRRKSETKISNTALTLLL